MSARAEGWFGRAGALFLDINYQLRPDVSEVEKLIQNAVVLLKSFRDELKESGEDRIEVDKLETAIRSLAKFRMAVMHYGREMAYDPSSDTSYQMQKVSREAQEHAHRAVDAFIRDINGDIHRAVLQSQWLHERMQTVAIGVFVIGALFALVSASFLIRSVKRPVRILVDATRNIAAGDLDKPVDAGESGIIGDLAQSLDSMRRQLQTSLKEQKQLAAEATSAAEAEKRRAAELSEANRQLKETIEERERIQQHLMFAKTAAEKANQTKSEFLANMSHELRTPLNHIIGFTELVADNRVGPLEPLQAEYLNDVLDSSRHLLDLINDILDLSKVEAGRMDLEISTVNPHALLKNSLTMVREKAINHGIELTLNAEELSETMKADERKLKQIIYNLLSNAVKFTPDGGKVAMEARATEGYLRTGRRRDDPALLFRSAGNSGSKKVSCVEIRVSDTGIGIQKDDLERIFQPFEQADGSTSRHYHGTGLGLSLTRQLVEMHGGTIHAESDGKDAGSSFFFVLPIDGPMAVS